jgi:hypothetical protein
MFKELYNNAQKLGAGYSKILETLDDPDDINMLTVEGSSSKVEDSMYNSPDVTPNTNHLSGILRSHRRTKTFSKNQSVTVLPKFNVNESITVLPSIKSSMNSMNREIDFPRKKKFRKETSTQRKQNKSSFLQNKE